MWAGDAAFLAGMGVVVATSSVLVYLEARAPHSYDRPQWVEVCDQTISESRLVAVSSVGVSMGGVSIGGGIEMVPRTEERCVKSHMEGW